ncbi:ras-domain-containing protein [Morchella conica CCBAS932]|uniref:Ras-domain-containing protein n=1 Tax=Morchella conica CCBAS932 TaxID=1392247 RepID=A0A3N4L1V7_9PEZI|nr:ras-domain-containing protein [Morchella conica CCBAS932]
MCGESAPAYIMRPPTVISGGQERVCLVTGVLVGMMTDITRTPRYCTNETALLLSIPLGDDHCLFFFFFFFFCTVTTVTATTTTTAIVTATTTTDSRRSRDNSSSRTNPEIRELHLADHRADTASQTKTQRQEILASHDTALGLHLTIRLCEGRFTPTHDVTIGVEFGSRIIPCDPTSTSPNPPKIKLQIWDTAGQESFRAITRSYFRGATGALLVYDITRRDTFTHVQGWLEELRGAAEPNISIILVGNKSDLADDGEGGGGKREVGVEEAREWARVNGVKAVVETSAKTGEGVEEAFVDVACEIYRNIRDGVYDLNDRSHGIRANSNTARASLSMDETVKARGGCC